MSLNDSRLSSVFDKLTSELSSIVVNDQKRLFAIDRLKTRLRKKAKFDAINLSVDTVQDFLNLNYGLQDNVDTADPLILNDARYFITKALENFTSSKNQACIQIPYDFMVLYDMWGYGPGACASGHAAHPVEKHLAAWDTTSAALPLLQKLRAAHPYLSLNDRYMGERKPFLCRGSRLSTVRKNEEKFRTIGMEPIGNMALQLAAGHYYEGALRHVGLDIRTQQPRNKAFARLGSIDGRFATLDLSEASNMILPSLVRATHPKEWFHILDSIRVHETELPDLSYEKLHMFSTMGNGFTFPLMTLTIVALIYGWRANYGNTRNLHVDWNKTCVFGDDIIIPTEEYEGITQTLESVGLVINHDKSFKSGPFRESCGGDYFEGYDVTPFYIKSLRHNADVYVAINQLLEWSARHDIFLWGTFELLKSYINGDTFFVPEWCGPVSGIRTTLVSRNYKTLQPIQKHEPVFNEPDCASLAVGGYLEVTRRGDLNYLPRQFKTRYRVTKQRLPRGFLCGRSPIDRSEIESKRIDLFLLMRGFGN